MLINGETRYFQKTSDEEKSNNEPIEVFIREQKYIIAESSPDKSELRISTDPQVRNDEYLSDFKEMNAMIEYQPINDDNGGLIKFDSKDQNVLEFDINPQDRGFTQNMVGGQIIIPDLFKVDGDEDTDNSLRPIYISTSYFYQSEESYLLLYWFFLEHSYDAH